MYAMSKLNKKQWAEKAAKISGSANKAHAELGTAPSTIFRSAERNNGFVEPRFYYMLIGLEYENDTLLQRCNTHRNNPTFLSLLDELDAKAELQEQIKQSQDDAEPNHQAQKNTPLNP